ncbi:hypothetical protein BD410DRAFT_291931 [Rickenella mellea]|uniref:Uncharacterized protein n=1 Tax=Rickenella mellea TaxID=50990 RepID=A0A4Y7PF77_9AGAM|nr:hypothetical protein BD410DRAFT_291931 [Rickenella mellea]
MHLKQRLPRWQRTRETGLVGLVPWGFYNTVCFSVRPSLSRFRVFISLHLTPLPTPRVPSSTIPSLSTFAFNLDFWSDASYSHSDFNRPHASQGKTRVRRSHHSYRTPVVQTDSQGHFRRAIVSPSPLLKTRRHQNVLREVLLELNPRIRKVDAGNWMGSYTGIMTILNS